MDIAKYIGLYLLKNNFCYIHGLGNLELKKKAASYDGQALQPPQYEVLLTPTGSIDDNLANFIATIEQTSISKAANSLREFSIASKTTLQEGKDVEVPSLGKFTMVNGRVQFITDPKFQFAPPSIPVLKTVRKEEKPAESFADTQPGPSGGRINWPKIILWLFVLIVVVVGVIFLVRYLNDRAARNASEEVVIQSADTQQRIPVITPPVIDTLPATDSAAAVTSTQNADSTLQLKVIINTYDNNAKAQKRLKQLKGFGHDVTLVTRDSTTYYVVLPVRSAAADTAHLLDSLKKNLNPKGVSILQ